MGAMRQGEEPRQPGGSADLSITPGASCRSSPCPQEGRSGSQGDAQGH
jgi:hypothetical protein